MRGEFWVRREGDLTFRVGKSLWNNKPVWQWWDPRDSTWNDLREELWDTYELDPILPGLVESCDTSQEFEDAMAVYKRMAK